MRITASKLRENIYQILDRVAETGTSVEILRNGRIIRLVLDDVSAEEGIRGASKFSRLVRRDVIQGDPQDLVHMDWSSEWKG